eukprot:gene6860-biopygen13378
MVHNELDVAYDDDVTTAAAATSAEWMHRIVEKIMGGDEAMARFLQRLLGYGITGEALYKDPVTVMPRHLAILVTNHMLEMSDVIVAMVERILVIEFPVTFRDLIPGESETATLRQCDRTMKKRLKAPEGQAALFAWLVEGAVAWYSGTESLKAGAGAKEAISLALLLILAPLRVSHLVCSAPNPCTPASAISVALLPNPDTPLSAISVDLLPDPDTPASTISVALLPDPDTPASAISVALLPDPRTPAPAISLTLLPILAPLSQPSFLLCSQSWHPCLSHLSCYAPNPGTSASAISLAL